MITNEQARKAIEKYQKEHPLPYGTIDVTAISSKEGADIISQAIERISKQIDEDRELWCICEMAKMYMQGVRPVYYVNYVRGEWNPITYRPMTEEEVKRVETYFGLPLDEKDKKCFSCPMPEHGQEILISTKWGVSKDICLYDCDEGFSLDERGDWEDVDAWMPLPEPYKEGDK